MGKFIESFEHELEMPFSYTKAGEMVKAEKLLIKAPNNKVSQYTAIIEQQFSKSLMEFQKFASTISDVEKDKAEKKKKGDDLDGDAIDSIIMMLMSSSDVDKCFVALQKILTHQFSARAMCYADGTEPLTVPMYDELSYHDTKQILGKYIENFISSSLKG